jgi:hypothetical protein
VIKRILPSKQLTSVLSMPCIRFSQKLKQYHWTESMFYGYPVLLSLGDRFDEVIDFMNLHKSKK